MLVGLENMLAKDAYVENTQTFSYLQALMLGLTHKYLEPQTQFYFVFYLPTIYMGINSVVF